MRRLACVIALAVPMAGFAHEVPCTIPDTTATPQAAAPAAEAPAAAPAVPAAPAAPSGPLRLMPLTTVKPQMPDEACRQRLSGTVDLDFVVLPDGKVAQVVVTKSDPPGVFDKTASDAVAQSTYAPQAAPVKMKRRMLLNASDCRSEQLRAAGPSAEQPAGSQVDCITLSAEAKGAGERFEAAESGRVVLQGEAAQTYWAPGSGCLVKGKTLRPGTRLTAFMEYKGYSLVSAKGGEEAAVWVRSNQLADQ
jgi:TonB family protein